MITIERLTEATETELQDINRLLPQLRENSSEHEASMSDLKAITNDKNVALIVVKNDNHIIGMATLYILTKFSKRIAHVEDVVVDNTYRGQGLGEKIMKHVIEVARSERVRTLSLTSRPERVAGNKLYQKLGFEKKETNSYRLKL